jgi:hypothetical protein
MTDDVALKATEMFKIYDDTLTNVANHGGGKGETARRNVNRLTGQLTPVGEHVFAEQGKLKTRVTSAILVRRRGRGQSRFPCRNHPPKLR